MTIETRLQAIPEPDGYGSNVKPPDLVEVLFYWVDTMRFFALGDVPEVKGIKPRIVGHKTKTKFRVDLVTRMDDGTLPFMAPEQLVELGNALALYVSKNTGLSCEKVNPALIDHG